MKKTIFGVTLIGRLRMSVAAAQAQDAPWNRTVTPDVTLGAEVPYSIVPDYRSYVAARLSAGYIL